MPKLNRHFKEINVSELEAITDKHIKENIVKVLKAIDGYVCMAMISIGLILIIFEEERNKLERGTP